MSEVMKSGTLYLRKNKDMKQGENEEYWFGKVNLRFDMIEFNDIEVQLSRKELGKMIKRAASNPEDFKNTGGVLDILFDFLFKSGGSINDEID